MPNSARWVAWVAMLKQSDSALVQLATMAAASVLIWETMRQAPEPWRERLRSAYLVGLLILFVYLIGGLMDTTAYSWAVTTVMFVIGGALAFWWVQRKSGRDQNAIAEKEKLLVRLHSIAKEKIQQGEK
jgi:peptidoglycan/LPS O-acetylase OafA/YrhL